VSEEEFFKSDVKFDELPTRATMADHRPNDHFRPWALRVFLGVGLSWFTLGHLPDADRSKPFLLPVQHRIEAHERNAYVANRAEIEALVADRRATLNGVGLDAEQSARLITAAERALNRGEAQPESREQIIAHGVAFVTNSG